MEKCHFHLILANSLSSQAFYGIYDSKTSCFGGKETALYDERKAFYDTKTSCFGVGSNIAFITTREEKGKSPVVTGIKTGCCRERDGMLLICPARGKLLRRAGQYLVACVRISCGGRQKT
ncbi:hypothetical protein IKQ19_20125 [Candidatus Saccharibacteria bacterium]|nr:hypothetical protein [Candidatus Saccharibacteria bacterium]